MQKTTYTTETNENEENDDKTTNTTTSFVDFFVVVLNTGHPTNKIIRHFRNVFFEEIEKPPNMTQLLSIEGEHKFDA